MVGKRCDVSKDKLKRGSTASTILYVKSRFYSEILGASSNREFVFAEVIFIADLGLVQALPKELVAEFKRSLEPKCQQDSLKL